MCPMLEAQKDALQRDGYVVCPAMVGPAARAAALRRLNLAIRAHGLTAEEILQCQSTTYFPHLRWEPEVWGLLPEGVAELLGWQEGDEWAEPQILLRFPDEDQPWPLEPHVDHPPDWAGDRPYRGIVGVALTSSGPEEGPPMVWPRSHSGGSGGPIPLALSAGDVLVMHPLLAHSGSLNLGANVRYAVYFRLLAGPAA
jgi:hypothetical protein